MRDCAARQAGDPWVRAAGPYASDLLDRSELPVDVLDRAVPDRPAVVVGGLGHSTWVNSRGLEAAGIDGNTPDPRGGIIHRDPATGRPSGVLLEAAQHLALDVSESPTPENLEAAYQGLLTSIRRLNRNGITSISDAGGYWTRGHPETWRRVEADGLLTVRASNALYVFPYRDFREQIRALESLFSDERGSRLRFNQAKLYVDGILDLGTGAVLEPYLGDDAGSRGMTYFGRRRLNRYARRLQDAGFQLHFHAVGDRAVRLALDAVERARGDASGPSENAGDGNGGAAGGDAVEGVYAWIPHSPFDSPNVPNEFFSYRFWLNRTSPDAGWSEVSLQSWLAGRLFEEAFNRFPGFAYEVQGVFQEVIDGRKTFYTYVVKDE